MKDRIGIQIELTVTNMETLDERKDRIYIVTSPDSYENDIDKVIKFVTYICYNIDVFLDLLGFTFHRKDE